MKKVLFFISFLYATTIGAVGMQIQFQVSKEDPTVLNPPNPKSPINPPVVYLEDGVLTFTAGHPDYVLNIKDEDGEVMYSTVVTSSQTTVVLPSTLSGDYVIELVMGNWLFTGYIML